MEEKNSIQTLEEMVAGKFCMIGLPLTDTMTSDVTAIYLGKDKDGRYNFYDGGGNCGTFKLKQDFILQRDIKIRKVEDRTNDLYKELNKKEKSRNVERWR